MPPSDASASVFTMVENLRAQLNARGINPRAVKLPGDSGTPLEGALTIAAGPSGLVVATIDYGRTYPLVTADSPAHAEERLLAYLDQPLPAAVDYTPEQVFELIQKVGEHYIELMQRLAEPGSSLLIQLPAGLPLDRVGCLDGVILYPLNTSAGQRSLPQTALEGAEIHRFLSTGDILVRAELAQPWFGQPGGGLRFTLADDYTGIRDLVATGRLQRISYR